MKPDDVEVGQVWRSNAGRTARIVSIRRGEIPGYDWAETVCIEYPSRPHRVGSRSFIRPTSLTARSTNYKLVPVEEAA